MDDKRAQQLEQVENYWRSVEQRGRQETAEAQRHIQTVRQEEETQQQVRGQRQRQ